MAGAEGGIGREQSVEMPQPVNNVGEVYIGRPDLKPVSDAGAESSDTLVTLPSASPNLQQPRLLDEVAPAEVPQRVNGSAVHIDKPDLKLLSDTAAEESAIEVTLPQASPSLEQLLREQLLGEATPVEDQSTDGSAAVQSSITAPTEDVVQTIFDAYITNPDPVTGLINQSNNRRKGTIIRRAVERINALPPGTRAEVARGLLLGQVRTDTIWTAKGRNVAARLTQDVNYDGMEEGQATRLRRLQAAVASGMRDVFVVNQQVRGRGVPIEFIQGLEPALEEYVFALADQRAQNGAVDRQMASPAVANARRELVNILFRNGYENPDIGVMLNISQRTVRSDHYVWSQLKVGRDGRIERAREQRKRTIVEEFVLDTQAAEVISDPLHPQSEGMLTRAAILMNQMTPAARTRAVRGLLRGLIEQGVDWNDNQHGAVARIIEVVNFGDIGANKLAQIRHLEARAAEATGYVPVVPTEVVDAALLDELVAEQVTKVRRYRSPTIDRTETGRGDRIEVHKVLTVSPEINDAEIAAATEIPASRVSVALSDLVTMGLLTRTELEGEGATYELTEVGKTIKLADPALRRYEEAIAEQIKENGWAEGRLFRPTKNVITQRRSSVQTLFAHGHDYVTIAGILDINPISAKSDLQFLIESGNLPPETDIRIPSPKLNEAIVDKSNNTDETPEQIAAGLGVDVRVVYTRRQILIKEGRIEPRKPTRLQSKRINREIIVRTRRGEEKEEIAAALDLPVAVISNRQSRLRSRGVSLYTEEENAHINAEIIRLTKVGDWPKDISKTLRLPIGVVKGRIKKLRREGVITETPAQSLPPEEKGHIDAEIARLTMEGEYPRDIAKILTEAGYKVSGYVVNDRRRRLIEQGVIVNPPKLKRGRPPKNTQVNAG